MSTLQSARWAIVAVASLMLSLTSACRPQSESRPAPTTTRAAAALNAFVSIPPQAYFVERVGGERVMPHVLVGPGQSPHTFEPTARQLEQMARADVYFRIGVDFEEGLIPKIERAFEKLPIVDTRAGIELRNMEVHCAHEGHDHHHHHHETGQQDPHIWLAPPLAQQQARTVCEALIELDPEHGDVYRANLEAFEAELAALHARLSAALEPVKGEALFVFHPAFGYFADAYGLEQVPVEIEGKEPTARELSAVIKRMKEANAHVIFVQPQFSSSSAEAIAQQIDGAVVSLDPLARDYVANLERVAEKVRAALSEE